MRGSDDPDARRAFDEFDFIPVRGIDENKSATGGGCSWAVCYFDTLRIERRDGVVEIVYLKGKMDQVLLNFHRPARRKTGQFNQLIAVGNSQESQLRATRRCFPFQDFEPQHRCVKANGLVQIADPHAGVK
jgi:hypothetical protein